MIEQQDTSALADERQAIGDRAIRRSQQLRPMPPPQWSVTATGRGIRVWILDYDQTVQPNSNVGYNIRHTADCDLTTMAGILSAFNRAKIVGTLPATAGPAVESETTIVDEDKQTGFFFITGVDKDSNESGFTSPPRFIAGQGLSSTIPGNVTRFSASESGQQQDNTMYSIVSLSMLAPDPLGSFFAVQPVLENYPNREDITSFGRREYSGIGGGKIEWQMLLPVGRRHGKGTVTATNGSATVTFGGAENCLVSVAAGEYLEILGIQAQVKSVNSTTQITLGVPSGASINWAGKSVVALADYDFIATVTIYIRSVAEDGNGEVDLALLPSQTVILDGLLSVPNAPVLSAARNTTNHISTIGNINRLFIAPVLGTQIKGYYLYRGTGVALAFTDGGISRIETRQADHLNTTGLIQIDDQNFTVVEREQNQTFSYYATAINARDQESAPSNEIDVACRLDAPNDNSPTIPGGSVVMNLCYDSYIYGIPGKAVTDGTAAQDTFQGAAPLGFNWWSGVKIGAGATIPGFQNNTELLLPQPAGAPGDYCAITQDIGAWQAAGSSRRIDKGVDLTLSFFAYTTGGLPNGTLQFSLAMMNGGGQVGYYAVKTRVAPNDAFDYSQTVVTIPGSSMSVTPNMQLYFATFSPQTIPANVDAIEIQIFHVGTTNGVNIIVSKVMLNFGDQCAAWTPQLSTATFPLAGGPIPHPPRDGDGSRHSIIPLMP